MRLKVLLPTEVLLDAPARKVSAEGVNGAFCLLPRHIDFVTALAPGLFSYETPEGQEVFLALDEGILVKCGPEVMVSARRAVAGAELGSLKDAVDGELRKLDERERNTRTAMARLEAGFVRHLSGLGGSRGS